MKEIFKNYKVGDKVWKYGVGWIEITEINNDSIYQIICSDGNTYSIEGEYRISDSLPSIFPNEFQIPKEAFIKPLPKLEVDTKVLVWDDNSPKVKRYFSHFSKDGKIVCFTGGATSWSANGAAYIHLWDNWELAQ